MNNVKVESINKLLVDWSKRFQKQSTNFVCTTDRVVNREVETKSEPNPNYPNPIKNKNKKWRKLISKQIQSIK